jgi:hypothetical protein
MSKAEQFFKTIAAPTVDEYLGDMGNLRRGILAAIVLYHTADYWKLENSGGNGTLQAICPDFQIIGDVANAAKHHVRSRRPFQISTSDQLGHSVGLFHAPFGEGTFAEAVEVVVELDDGTTRPLVPMVQSVLSMWKSIYP